MVNKAKSTGIASISDVCACFEIKRDAYYKFKKRSNIKESRNNIILELVNKNAKINLEVERESFTKRIASTEAKKCRLSD